MKRLNSALGIYERNKSLRLYFKASKLAQKFKGFTYSSESDIIPADSFGPVNYECEYLPFDVRLYLIGLEEEVPRLVEELVRSKLIAIDLKYSGSQVACMLIGNTQSIFLIDMLSLNGSKQLD